MGATPLIASHLVIADGKRSCLRRSAASYAHAAGVAFGEPYPKPFEWEEHVEPSWGVFLDVPLTPKAWRTDATTVFQSKDHGYALYAIAAPLPNGRCSAVLVAYESILDTYPWLAPPDHPDAFKPPPPPPTERESGSLGGSATGSSLPPTGYGAINRRERAEVLMGGVWGGGGPSDAIFRRQLAAMLADQMPAFAVEISGGDPEGVAVRGARVRRRTSWIELTSGRYETMHGAIVLVGDAAHGMTPSIGEGANYALDSAYQLAERVAEQGTPSMLNLTNGFKNYGERRPNEVRAALLKSALVSRGGASSNATERLMAASAPPAPLAPPLAPYAGTMRERGMPEPRKRPDRGQGRMLGRGFSSRELSSRELSSRELSSIDAWVLEAASYASGDEHDSGTMATCGVGGGEPSFEQMDEAMNTFLHQWRERLEGWWIAAPMRDGLQACFGALGLHLASRLEFHWATIVAKALGRPTVPRPPPVLGDDSECKWIEDGTTHLDLPDFPDLPMQFELPTVPPIPRLLPEWGWVHSLAPQQSERIGLHARQPSALSEPAYMGFGVGIGVGALAGVALLGRMRRTRTGALECRSTRSKSAQSTRPP